MSIDGRYIIMYDDYRLMCKDKKFLENTYGGECLPMPFSNSIYYNKPKYTLGEDDYAALNCLQILESTNEDNEWYFVHSIINHKLHRRSRKEKMYSTLLRQINQNEGNILKIVTDFIESEVNEELERLDRVKKASEKVREAQSIRSDC